MVVDVKRKVSVIFTKMTRRRGGLGDIGSLGPVRGDPLATFVPMLAGRAWACRATTSVVHFEST